MKRWYCIVILLILTSQVQAYFLPLTARSTKLYDMPVAEVVYGTEVIARFFEETGGQTQLERAEQYCSQIKQMAALGLTTSDIQIISDKNQVTAKVKDVVIFTLTAKEISINLSPPDQLAKEWIQKIKLIFDAIPGYAIKDFTYQDPNKMLPYIGYAMGANFSRNNPFSAAHRYFPKGTKIRILNPINSWSVIVETGDRMDIPDGVTILLDLKAAEAVGVSNTQTTRVILQQVTN